MGKAAGRKPRIILTREPEDNASLREGLENLGAAVVEIPAIETAPVEPLNGESVLSDWAGFGWTVFTSRRAVRFFLKWAERREAGYPPNARVAAVGKSTAEYLIRAGLPVEVIPGTEDGRRLGEDLASGYPVSHALFPVSKRALRTAQEVLRGAGWRVSELTVYEVTPRHFRDEEISLMEEGAELIFFASPSAFDGFENDPRAFRAISGIPVLPLGKSTLERAKNLRLDTLQPPPETGRKALIDSISRFLRLVP